jgi:hypothetical protein
MKKLKFKSLIEKQKYSIGVLINNAIIPKYKTLLLLIDHARD